MLCFPAFRKPAGQDIKYKLKLFQVKTVEETSLAV